MIEKNEKQINIKNYQSNVIALTYKQKKLKKINLNEQTFNSLNNI